jgi:hypothetical protein
MIQRATRRKFLWLLALAPAAVRSADPVRVDLSIARGKPDGGVRTVRVMRSDTVELRVRSDETLKIHVHGYDLLLEAKAGNPASVSFAAKLVGRFPVTAHLDAKGSHKEPTLLYLEVHPR